MDYKQIKEYDDYLVIEDVKNFKLKQTFECGQCFRFHKISDTNYITVAFERVIELEEDGNDIKIYNSSREDVENIWIDYFDLNRDYSKIKEELSKDDLLRKSVEYGPGIRILNQDPFEILISFIISARNSIPSIMKTINKISAKWGRTIEYKGNTYNAFPTIEQIKDATLEEIQETGASFRSKYIIDTISNVYSSYKAKKDKDSEKIEEFKKFSENNFSKFEKEVLTYLIRGYSYREIATILSKNLKSIDNTIQRIRKKSEEWIKEEENIKR